MRRRRPGEKLSSVVGSSYYVSPEARRRPPHLLTYPNTNMYCPASPPPQQRVRLGPRVWGPAAGGGAQVLRRAYSVEADIWSLGVMLYILLSGLPPFWGDTEEDIFRMVLKARPRAGPSVGTLLDRLTHA